MSDTWKRYVEVKRMEGGPEKLQYLMEFAEMEEDAMLCRGARAALGKMLWEGDGVAVDKEEGRELLENALELGDLDAMHFLGEIFIEEGDVEKGKEYISTAERKQAENKLLAQDIMRRLRGLSR